MTCPRAADVDPFLPSVMNPVVPDVEPRVLFAAGPDGRAGLTGHFKAFDRDIGHSNVGRRVEAEWTNTGSVHLRTLNSCCQEGHARVPDRDFFRVSSGSHQDGVSSTRGIGRLLNRTKRGRLCSGIGVVSVRRHVQMPVRRRRGGVIGTSCHASQECQCQTRESHDSCGHFLPSILRSSARDSRQHVSP